MITLKGVQKHEGSPAWKCWVNGGVVESRYRWKAGWSSWCESICPYWEESDDIEYRPKAEPQTKTMWLTIYPNNKRWIYESREQADACAFWDRIACVPVTITWTEGKGL